MAEKREKQTKTGEQKEKERKIPALFKQRNELGFVFDGRAGSTPGGGRSHTLFCTNTKHSGGLQPIEIADYSIFDKVQLSHIHWFPLGNVSVYFMYDADYFKPPSGQLH